MTPTYGINPERLGKVENGSTKNQLPLTLDALARRDDEPTAERAPEDVRIGLAQSRLAVTIPSDALTLKEGERHDQSKPGGSELLLPEHSFIGIKVREIRLHERGSLAVPEGPQKPHRPRWQRFQCCPRPSGVERKLLRRSNGRIVAPTDSGRVYGEYPARMPFYPSGYPWGCIGRLFVWADATSPNWSSYGSAALIGTRAILTAAHMVPWGSGSNWKALFIAG